MVPDDAALDIDEDDASLAGDFSGQVRCIFRKMARQLEEADASLDDVVTMTAHIINVSDNTAFVELRKRFFKEDRYPASTLVTVKALNNADSLVEITAIAVTAS